MLLGRLGCLIAVATALLTFLIGEPLFAAETPCGEGCLVPGGRYRIVRPSTSAGARVPVVVLLHGFRSSAAEMVAYPELAEGLTARGIALIAPDGDEGGWSVPGAPPRLRDDAAFLDAVLADAERRFGIDPDRTVLAGFSLGASMAWLLACADGTRYRRVLAVAGAFWNPLPSHCAGPVPRLLHVHGRTDRTVPMEGRMIRERWRQGDVLQSFAVWRRHCPAGRPAPSTFAGLACERVACADGRLELCMHGNGHDLDGRWIVDGAVRLLATD
jgi:polyhydroxybutyrate depolymerase